MTFIALVFLAPHCDTDAQRVWQVSIQPFVLHAIFTAHGCKQNYYLLCIGIVKMFVSYLHITSIHIPNHVHTLAHAMDRHSLT